VRSASNRLHARASDHIGGVAALKQAKPEAKIIIRAMETALRRCWQPAWSDITRAQWGGLGFEFAQPPSRRLMEDGQRYDVGNLALKVIHCPRSTRPRHVVLFDQPNERYSSACLFAGSIAARICPEVRRSNAGSIMNKLWGQWEMTLRSLQEWDDDHHRAERLTNPF